MTRKRRTITVKNERAHNNDPTTTFERFEDFVKKIAAVPKEEVDELRAEQERDKKEGAG